MVSHHLWEIVFLLEKRFLLLPEASVQQFEEVFYLIAGVSLKKEMTNLGHSRNFYMWQFWVVV